MSQAITSAALAFLQKALGLAGRAQSTELEDGSMQLVLDAANMASAAQPGLLDQGFFLATAVQSHGGAGALSETIDIYGATTFSGGLVAKMLAEYDVWISGATFASSAGISEAQFSIAANSGMPFLSSDGTATINSIASLLTWDSTVSATGALIHGLGDVMLERPLRLPRSAGGVGVASRATAAATVTWLILCELVRPGLRPSSF